MDKEIVYKQIIEELDALIRDVSDPLANYANAAALLYQSLPNINWAGFYFFREERLVLGPFQGKPACVYIPVGKGVCGTAYSKHKTLIVDDVLQFPGHIACDAASRSEIVVPLINGSDTLGVLDIDSPLLKRFDKTDSVYLEKITMKLLRKCAGKTRPEFRKTLKTEHS